MNELDHEKEGTLTLRPIDVLNAIMLNVIKQRKRQALYSIIYKKDLKSKPHKKQSRMVVPGARGRGNGKSLLQLGCN